jgi:hypothetical protein
MILFRLQHVGNAPKEIGFVIKREIGVDPMTATKSLSTSTPSNNQLKVVAARAMATDDTYTTIN